MTGGNPILTLSAGYIGSTLLGAALIFCSFDIKASKIAYLATVPLWVPVAWFGLTWCVDADQPLARGRQARRVWADWFVNCY